uniref:DUF927 domain-containing protein n=1 Tax=Candidatus Methanophagaceae archaeon ANME-1 ERB6 TaxID=2759912 RepID=A0A7G9YZF4_9EURY|nr:hypothetical protein OJFPBHNK_00014 [Methanosarcinales archaeon ANME-1 ERB6]
MVDKTSENKSLSVSKLESKLNELAMLYGASAGEFMDLHSECFDSSEDHKWSRLCGVFPELETAHQGDKNNILELLAELHQRKQKKGKRTAPKEEKSILTVDEIKSLEDDNGKGIIANYVIYKKVFDGRPVRFTVKVHLEDGKIKEEVEPEQHSIPEQTAPTVNFCDADCDSPKEIYNELKRIHQDYAAFGTDRIYPTLTSLGSMASYYREAFYTFPYFDIISGEPECGKTTAMKILVFTSYYGTVASSVSEALLFREIDSSHCFYGLDNIERLFARPQDYAGIIDWLLSSYSRDIPCKRLAKVGDNFEVVSFDGYGEKAFTHITDFPVSLSTLKSRCIQIVMQKGKPTKFYPTPDKFAGIRDKMYHARLREYQRVKDTYEELVRSNVLIGRTGDLYYPLLSIAKLISEDVYKEVLNYAKETERERTEVDEWNRELINLLYDEGIYGSISPKDIRRTYQDRLRDAGLLKEEKVIYTRTVTNKLKKLGFKRDSKTTDNKTWFLIDEKTVSQRAYEYGILNTPQNANLVTLSNSNGEEKKPKEEGAGKNSNNETSSEENEPNKNEEKKKLTKLDKLANTGVLDKEKQKPEKNNSSCKY